MSAEPRIPRLHRPDPAEFRRRFVARGRPAVLSGIADRWPAVARWSPGFFRERFADAPVRYVERDAGATDGGGPEPTVLERALARRRIDSTLGEFVERMSAGDAVDRYLIVSPLLERRPELLADVEPLDRYQLAPWLPRRLRAALQQTPLFWMGPEKLASPLHAEPVNNLFVQIHGTKDWLLYPPQESANLYFPWPEHPDELMHWSPVAPERPDHGRFPRYRSAAPLRVTVAPGEILFVPAGWWHFVRYHGAGISLTWFWYGPWSSTARCWHLHGARLRRRLRGRGAEGARAS